MPQTDDRVAREVVQLSVECLEGCVARIRHCLSQLSDDQVWWRPREEMNSIGNLLLHLTGNVRQWIVSGIGGAPDIRQRPTEFSQRTPVPPEQLLDALENVVADAKDALLRASADDLLQERQIQGWTVNGYKALSDCIPHFKGHTQEIICLTRMQLGGEYKFYWSPETAEQGGGQ